MKDLEFELLRKEQEIRALPKAFADDKDGFEKALGEKSAELRAIKQKIDLEKMPSEPRGEEDRVKPWKELMDAMVQKRSITMNGAQAVNMVSEIYSANQILSKFFPLVSQFTGAFGETRIPVMNPAPALPVATTEGDDDISPDTTAVYAGKSLTLKPWCSIIPVSRGLDDGLSVDSFREKMVSIFQKAFLSAIDKGILIGAGSGSDALGVFVASAVGVPTSCDINCAATGAPKLVDLINMVSQLKGYNTDEALAIAIAPSFIASMLAESSSSYEAIKNEILLKGTCRGAKILESGHCPTTTTTGSYVAVGGPFKDFAWAYGLGLKIVPVEKSRSDQIDYNAYMYQDGRPIVGANFRRLITVAA